MKNKITVSIAGQEYTMVAEEGKDYVQHCANLVDQQIQEIMKSSPLGRSDAAVLALKAGSACVLRGGKEAHRSAAAIKDENSRGVYSNPLTTQKIIPVKTTNADEELNPPAEGKFDSMTASNPLNRRPPPI